MPKISPRIKKINLVVGLSLGLACATTARAQESPPTQENAMQQLLQRVNELEARVKQLEAQQAALLSPAPVTAPAPPAPVPAPEAAPAQPEVNEVAERLKLLMFGDVGFQQGRYYAPHNTFEFGEFNMFATARLSKHLSVLADLLLISNSDNTIGIDVERFLLKYKQSDYFSASIGRIHSAIGYYNTAFDRGEYFQTPIGRPAMYEFDDQGGFLPLQDIGVVLNGNIPSGKLGLAYVFELTNGRAYGANVEPSQNGFDGNNRKAINFGLSARPDAVRGLLVGFSFRHDKLTDVLNLGVSETIPVVYAVYQGHNLEWLNEAMYVRHALPSGAVFHTPGFYSQISRGFGSYRPYFLYSYVNAPFNDPIYGNPAEIAIVGRIKGPSIGVRYDFTRYTAFKLQYQRQDLNFAPTANGIAAQFAFTF